MLPPVQPPMVPLEPPCWPVLTLTGVELPGGPGVVEDGTVATSAHPRRRSFCGPRSEEEWGDLMAHRGSFRYGEVGRSEVRCVSGQGEPDHGVLCEYYGDMANRDGDSLHCSHHPQGSRRVLGNRPAQQQPNGPGRDRHGYGSLASRRRRVMEEGGLWGEVEVRCVPVETWPLADEMCQGLGGPEDVCVLRQTDNQLHDAGKAFASDKCP